MVKHRIMAAVFLIPICLFSTGMAPVPAKPLDTTPPQVSITFPLNNTTISGTVNIRAQASDNVGVDKIEIYLDNILTMTDKSSASVYTWNTAMAVNGSHVIKVIAYDARKNSNTAQIAVTVNNSPGPGPSGELVPISGAAVSSQADTGRSARQAVDNSMSTYWQGRYASFLGIKLYTKWWLRLDLDKPYTLSGISIYWDKSYGASDYSIQGSNDNITWVNLAINQSSLGAGANPYRKDHTLSSMCKYIRIDINKAQLDYPRIYEVSIYRIVGPLDTEGPIITITSPKDGEVIK